MKIIFIVLVIIGIVVIFPWITMLLWNILMPDIFGLVKITFWQAWGLLLLSFLLFRNVPTGNKNN
jgi:hypothetical protein